MQLDTHKIDAGAAVPLIAIISNPKSTTNSARLPGVRKIVEASANIVHFELDGMETVAEALGLFARANPALLIINGGDGTIGVVLAALLHNNPFTITPPVAFLPGGKTNMTAGDLGFKGRPERVLRRLIKLTRQGKLADRLAKRNLIEMDMGDGGPLHVGTFFGGAGVIKGIHWCRDHAYGAGLPNSLAHVAAILKLLSSAFGFGKEKRLMVSDPMTITNDEGMRVSGEFSVVAVTTLNKLLLGLKPYGKNHKEGLRFSAVDAGGKNLLRALSALVVRAFGNREVEGVHTCAAGALRIEGSDPVTLDGEIYYPVPGKEIVLRGNRALTFVALN